MLNFRILQMSQDIWVNISSFAKYFNRKNYTVRCPETYFKFLFTLKKLVSN